MTDLKTLNDKRQDHRLTQAERDEAQKQWDAAHREIEEMQKKEEFENSFWSGE